MESAEKTSMPSLLLIARDFADPPMYLALHHATRDRLPHVCVRDAGTLCGAAGHHRGVAAFQKTTLEWRRTYRVGRPS
jgi:hypothetical protein